MEWRGVRSGHGRVTSLLISLHLSSKKCRRQSPRRRLSKRRNMSGPIVGRAQTLGDGVQTGAKAICAVCDKTDKLSRCSRCKVVFYCTKEHQRRDWKHHRVFCATHPAAAAPAEDPLPVAAAAAAVANTETVDREISSKRHPSVGNNTASSAPLPNLNRTSVPNVTPEPRQENAKHLAGMRAREASLFRAASSDFRRQARILRSRRILRGNDYGNLVADNVAI